MPDESAQKPIAGDTDQPSAATGQTGTTPPPPATDIPSPPPALPDEPFMTPVSEETPPVGIFGGDTSPNPVPTSESGIPAGTSESIIPPVIATPPSPPNSRAKIVGSILALLILVIGVPTGIFLMGQQQELREKAAEGTYTLSGTVKDANGGAITNATICLDPPGNSCAGTTFRVITIEDGRFGMPNVPAGGNGHNVYLDPASIGGAAVTSPNPQLIGGDVSSDTTVNFTVQAGAQGPTTYTLSGTVKDANGGAITNATICLDPPGNSCAGTTFRVITIEDGRFGMPNVPCGGDGHNVYLDPSSVGGATITSPNPQLILGNACANTSLEFTVQAGGSGSAPITAQCRNIKVYNPTTGSQLTADQLSQLKAGDTVRLAVGGSTSGGAIDRVRFKVNSQFAPDAGGVTAKNSSGEFFLDYTIPADTRNFSIGAELHHTDSSIGWF